MPTPFARTGGFKEWKERFAAEINSGGGSGPTLLPHLGSGFLKMVFPKFDVVACTGCGLTRFFVDGNAKERIPSNPKWKRIGQEPQPTG